MNSNLQEFADKTVKFTMYVGNDEPTIRDQVTVKSVN